MTDEQKPDTITTVITPTEDNPLYLLFYDDLFDDTDHVYMPIPGADDPYGHWPEDKRP